MATLSLTGNTIKQTGLGLKRELTINGDVLERVVPGIFGRKRDQLRLVDYAHAGIVWEEETSVGGGTGHAVYFDPRHYTWLLLWRDTESSERLMGVDWDLAEETFRQLQSGKTDVLAQSIGGRFAEMLEVAIMGTGRATQLGVTPSSYLTPAMRALWIPDFGMSIR